MGIFLNLIRKSKKGVFETYSEVLQILESPLCDFFVDLVHVCHLLDPRMVKRINGADSLVRVIGQQFANQVFGFVGDVGPLWFANIILASEHCLNDLFITASIEGRVATKQDVEDDSATPQVTLLVVILLQHFWCNVVRGSKLL